MTGPKKPDTSLTTPAPPALEQQMAHAVLYIDRGLRKPWPGDAEVIISASSWAALVAMAKRVAR